MRFRDFIKEKTGVIGGTVLLLAAFHMIGYACKVRTDFILIISVLSVLLVLGTLAREYEKKRRFYQEITEILNQLDQKYLITEMDLAPDFLDGKLWMDMLYDIGKSMQDRLSDTENRGYEFREYLEMWVHEIKIPLAALELMNYNGNTDPVKQKQLIGRLNRLTEQILFYARADVPEKDYLLAACNLDHAINRALQEQKDLLIAERIRIRKEHTDVEVVTDSKWLIFLIGQIVNNAVKYRDSQKEPEICFSVADEPGFTALSIRDNGIGIPACDIDRIFERTFTGENGRRGCASTGMGLYICRRLAEKLGHEITASSEQGEYTEILLRFGKNSYYDDVISSGNRTSRSD